MPDKIPDQADVEKKPDSITLIPQDAYQTMHSDSPSLLTSHNFSIQLLQFADLFTELSARFEDQYTGEILTSAMSLGYRANITAAVFSAWSFVDATVNEFFWAARENSEAIKDLGPELISELGTISKEDLHQSTLDKYQKALEITHKDLFCRGGSPYQQAFLLSRLRNQLIHFEPEWVGEKLQELEKDLKGKFKLSPFFAPGSSFFPHRCLSYGCAEWSLRSALQFVDDFNARIGIKPKYESVRSGLNITVSKKSA